MSSEQPVPAPASTAVPTAGSGVPSSGRLPGRDWSGWVWLGWLVAHLIPVIWIGIAGTSTGDVKYYFSGVTDRDPTAMTEYPEVGTWPAERLGEGINISSATPDGWVPGGPWDAQAATLIILTDSRNQLVQADKLSGLYLGGNPNLAEASQRIAGINERMEALQRLVVKPVPYRFVLKRLPPSSRP